MQWMETTGPPAAATIRIGAEIEERIDQRDIPSLGHRDQRRRVEAEQRLVDRGPGDLTVGKHPSQGGSVRSCTARLNARPASRCQGSRGHGLESAHFSPTVLATACVHILRLQMPRA
jgi:hypothetical protein